MQPAGRHVIAVLGAGLLACNGTEGAGKLAADVDGAGKSTIARPADDAPDAKTSEAPPNASAPRDSKPAAVDPREATAAETTSPPREPSVGAMPPAIAPAAAAPDASAPRGPVFVDGNIDLSLESVGELHTEMTAAEVEARFGKPAKVSKIEEEGASGEFVQSWHYPDKGVVVGMTAISKKGAQTVRSLSADPSCKLPLSWGLTIGSTRAEVEKVYGDHFEPESTTAQTFVAGSIYGGAIYTFADGKVTHLFLGAAAE